MADNEQTRPKSLPITQQTKQEKGLWLILAVAAVVLFAATQRGNNAPRIETAGYGYSPAPYSAPMLEAGR